MALFLTTMEPFWEDQNNLQHGGRVFFAGFEQPLSKRDKETPTPGVKAYLALKAAVERLAEALRKVLGDNCVGTFKRELHVTLFLANNKGGRVFIPNLPKPFCTANIAFIQGELPVTSIDLCEGGTSGKETRDGYYNVEAQCFFGGQPSNKKRKLEEAVE